jgi:hypothetical protein
VDVAVKTAVDVSVVAVDIVVAVAVAVSVVVDVTVVDNVVDVFVVAVSVAVDVTVAVVGIVYNVLDVVVVVACKIVNNKYLLILSIIKKRLNWADVRFLNIRNCLLLSFSLLLKTFYNGFLGSSIKYVTLF